ncbi:pentapeptide repeat-containing protein [Pseudonocardia sp. TRM90224]|uniref:pentapeptide repeat-containing protein n=1 Tax=Pseudonocardia sp. TRM90224 TaxID=2812678 RepID=UPI001E56080F|nr:pentapeptide repeat-containing protein [Pseudonocardia sp. TRM90224]
MSGATVVEDRDASDPEVDAALAAGAGPKVFRRCTFVEADLTELDLSGIGFEQCTMTGARFTGSDLDGVQFVGGSLAGADLTRTDLTDAAFEGVDLTGARFTASLLTDTTFDECRLIGADLTSLRGVAMTFRFDRSTLQLANLQDAVLKGLRFVEVDLSEADLRGADLRETTFTRCQLRGTLLDDTKLLDADLRGADLGELTADSPRQLVGAIISTAQAAGICSALGLQVID